ncbi:hypothetical protein EVAR_20373_1 [Eumeta japonica]|uniref:Uncharacterized protein n=1 Tax=Eumeta variegata TaxID=151549 RepID=A0A4C1VUR5_EUMVA|nr:hypothetical protein EVAR_20373_1 [Eumeta japonica]
MPSHVDSGGKKQQLRTRRRDSSGDILHESICSSVPPTPLSEHGCALCRCPLSAGPSLLDLSPSFSASPTTRPKLDPWDCGLLDCILPLSCPSISALRSVAALHHSWTSATSGLRGLFLITCRQNFFVCEAPSGARPSAVADVADA